MYFVGYLMNDTSLVGTIGNEVEVDVEVYGFYGSKFINNRLQPGLVVYVISSNFEDALWKSYL